MRYRYGRSKGDLQGANMTKRQFSRAEIEYLRTLPSIDAVTDSRITYAREFQIDCMRRYLQGEKPTAIFISAGLSPSVIGHKRIERNIARWKRDEDIMRKAAEEPEPHIRLWTATMRCRKCRWARFNRWYAR